MTRNHNLRPELVAICRYVGKRSNARPVRPPTRPVGILAELAELRGLA